VRRPPRRYSPRLLAFHAKLWWNIKASCLVIPGIVLAVSVLSRFSGSANSYRAGVNSRGLAQSVCML
jgi:hypothetical protein